MDRNPVNYAVSGLNGRLQIFRFAQHKNLPKTSGGYYNSNKIIDLNMFSKAQ